MLIRKRWGRGRLLTALAYAVFAMVPIPLALWIAYGALVLMGPLGLVPGLLMGALVLGATLWMLMQSWRAAVDAWSSREVPNLMDHDPGA